MRKLFIGADSAGFTMKEELIPFLHNLGYTVEDCGCASTASCHYPLFANAVAEKVQAESDNAFGILICGTGIGMSMVANKHNGIRAALCSDTFSARMTRMHNDANIICLGARVLGIELVKDILSAFLSAEFEGGRHALRVDMITALEQK